MIRIEHISKSYGNIKAIDDVTFDVHNGEITAFVGLNGAGKTTTIKVSAGVIYPDRGDVLIDGYSIIKDKKIASKSVVWVPELPSFEMDMRAMDYFIYIAGYLGYPTSEAKELARELLSRVGLEGAERKRLKDYSQGMKKRFALALSMISDPQNFLFDEVLNGLDPEGIAFFRNFALELKKEGKAVLFSSHILSEVENLADRVVFIHKGRIVRVMRMDEVRNFVKPYLFLRVENPDSSLLEILSKYGRVEQSGNAFIIRDFNGDIGEVSYSISTRYKIVEIRMGYSSLEEVFFSIIGDRK
ncbi:MAG: ABC transporter ATP-binding protein [Sulfolobaceae archaeon]|nr:ABC transporter ATP-binding protein [Sulfolobaceae archaeon]